MKGAYLCKIGIRGNALDINRYVRSDAPEVLIRTFRGLSLSWSFCSLRSFSTKRQTWQFVQVSKLSYFFIKRRKLFLFAAVFGVDYMSLIIHHLDSIGEITNLAGGCKGSGG